MPAINRDALLRERPALLALADQRRAANWWPPHDGLTPETVVDATLCEAETVLVRAQKSPPEGLSEWLRARLMLIIARRFDDMIRDYTDRLAGHARQRLAKWRIPESVIEPREVAHEVWVRLYGVPRAAPLAAPKSRLESFNGTGPEQFWAWLRRTLDRRLSDLRRAHFSAKRTPHKEVRASGEADAADPFDGAIRVQFGSTPSSTSYREELRSRILGAADRFPEPDCSIAIRAINGETVEQIATELKSSTKEVLDALKRIERALLAAHPELRPISGKRHVPARHADDE